MLLAVFVLADLSLERPSCYFELGLAPGKDAVSLTYDLHAQVGCRHRALGIALASRDCTGYQNAEDADYDRSSGGGTSANAL